MADSVYFLGSRFDFGSIEEATCEILAETQGCFKYMVTPNVQHMVRILDDPATLQPLYERAWRVYCDSRVLSRLARLAGLRLPVITGSDLTADLIARAARQRLTVALVGPTAAVAAELKSRYPEPQRRMSHPADGIHQIGSRGPAVPRLRCQDTGRADVTRRRNAAAGDPRPPHCRPPTGAGDWIVHRRVDRLFSPDDSSAHPSGFRTPAWNGCTVSCRIRDGLRGVICLNAPDFLPYLRDASEKVTAAPPCHVTQRP
jgi:hypothetical protein